MSRRSRSGAFADEATDGVEGAEAGAASAAASSGGVPRGAGSCHEEDFGLASCSVMLVPWAAATRTLTDLAVSPGSMRHSPVLQSTATLAGRSVETRTRPLAAKRVPRVSWTWSFRTTATAASVSICRSEKGPQITRVAEEASDGFSIRTSRGEARVADRKGSLASEEACSMWVAVTDSPLFIERVRLCRTKVLVRLQPRSSSRTHAVVQLGASGVIFRRAPRVAKVAQSPSMVTEPAGRHAMLNR